MIFFSLTSLGTLLILFTEKIDWAMIVTFLMLSSMAITGWYARKFGLSGFKTHGFSMLSAIVSLIFGIIFIVLIPVLTSKLFGFNDSYEAIRNLIILITPVVISAIAILFSKSIENKNTSEAVNSV